MPDINIMQLLINFLSLSAFYALFAVGLALIFGVMKVVNFAHGEFFMLGGYALWLLLAALSGLPLWLVFIMALIVGPLVVAVLGIVVQRLIFEPTGKDTFGGFIASLGLSYILQALAVMGFGVVSKSLPVMIPGQLQIMGGTLTYQRLVVILGAVVMMIALWYFLYRTGKGRAVRAVAQNRDAAVLQGIDLRRVGMLTMAIGAAMAAVSGVLMASVINVSPYMGLEAIWKAFIVVIVGGLGSIPGAILAAMLFGLIDSIATTLGYGQYVIIIDTVIMLSVLAFFPRGLMGREAPLLDQGQVAPEETLQMQVPKAIQVVLIAAAATVLIGYPLFASSYYIGAGILFLINLMLVTSYRTVTTMGGWSFAHITMLAIGAYTTGLLQTQFNLSFWVILPASGLVAALVAIIIALPVMQTRQFYFFLSTFAAGEAIRQCFIQFRGTFGGIEGIPFLSPPETLFGLNFYNTTNYFYLVLVVSVICGGLLYIFDTSRTGRTIRAMSENENLSAAIGLNAFGLKILAFTLGSFFAGCAGALFAGYNGFVAPTDFTAQFMFKIIAAVVIGGNRTFWGPFLGLLVLTLIEELFSGANQLIPLFWGLTIIFTVLFMPTRLEGLALRCLGRTSSPQLQPRTYRRDRDAARA